MWKVEECSNVFYIETYKPTVPVFSSSLSDAWSLFEIWVQVIVRLGI